MRPFLLLSSAGSILAALLLWSAEARTPAAVQADAGQTEAVAADAGSAGPGGSADLGAGATDAGRDGMGGSADPGTRPAGRADAVALEPIAGRPGPLQEARQRYLQARRLMEKGRYRAAAPYLRRALQLTPTWSLPKLAQARCFRLLGERPDGRRQYLEEALEVDPENHRILYEMGLLLEEEGRLVQAVASYQKAVRRRSDLVHAQERLGVLLSGMGRLDRARSHLELALAHRPDNPIAISLLAVVLEGLHRYEEAEEQLGRLVQLSPEQPFLHARLAAFYHRRGRFEKMSEARARATEILERDSPKRQPMRPLLPASR